MSEKFKKLKRKYLLRAILKSFICALSVALFAVGAVLLVLKLSALSLDMLWYIVIGAGSALVSGVIAFIFFRPTDKKVAKKLDDEFGLDERVQTSLEYKGQEGTIVQMQRNDTDEKLKTLPRGKFKLAGVWQFCVIAIVSVAIACTALFIPAKQAGAQGPVDPEDLPAVVTEIHITSVNGIITNVKASSMDNEIKLAAVEDLQELLDLLVKVFEKEEGYEEFTQGELNNAVLDTIDGVNAVIDSSINYIDFAGKLVEAEETNLSAAVLAGGNSYRAYELKDYGHVETFFAQREVIAGRRIEAALGALRETMNVTLEDGLGNVVLSTATSLLTALIPDKLGVSRSDKIYDALSKFVSELAGVSRNISKGDYERVEENEEGEQVTVRDDAKVQKELDSKFESCKNQLAPVLAQQAYAGAMRRYIGNRLKIVFGLPGVEEKEDLDNTGNNGNNDPDTDPDKKPPENSGGDGDGKSKYGSDDEIYDPLTGEYVKYSTLLSRYQNILDELKKGEAITQEQYDMVRKYFRYLFGSDKAEELT